MIIGFDQSLIKFILLSHQVVNDLLQFQTALLIVIFQFIESLLVLT